MLAAKEIEIKGNKVSYYDEGKGETPIIFIHGFPFNKSMWNDQVTLLSADHRVIAYDVRGHGGSQAGVEEFTVDQFANDLFLLMDALMIKKAVICGLSMGGYVVLNALTKQRERIAGLILADTQCAADTEEGKDKRRKTIAFIKKNGLKEYAEESMKNLFAPQSFTDKKEQVAFVKTMILHTDADNICKTLEALATRSETCSTLDKVKIPTLILVGKEDKVTPLAAAQKMQELVTDSQLHIIDGAGHMSNLENLTDFTEHVKAFLKTNNF
jgi:3-oxoadipate enol-lactonase